MQTPPAQNFTPHQGLPPTRRTVVRSSIAALAALAVNGTPKAIAELTGALLEDANRERQGAGDQFNAYERTAIEFANIPDVAEQRVRYMRAYAIIVGKAAQYRAELAVARTAEDRDDLTTRFRERITDLLCERAELHPNEFGEMCRYAQEQDLAFFAARSDLNRDLEMLDNTREVLGTAGDFLLRVPNPYAVGGGAVAQATSAIITGLGAWREYDGRQDLHNQQMAFIDQVMADLAAKRDEIEWLMRHGAGRLPGGERGVALDNIDNMLQEPFTAFQQQENPDFDPDQPAELSPVTQAVLAKIMQAQGDQEQLNAYMIEAVDQLKESAHAQGLVQAEILTLLREEQEARHAQQEAQDRQREARKRALEIQAGIQLGALFIGRVLGKPEEAQIFQEFATRFVSAQQALKLFEKGKIDTLALTANWTGLAMFAIDTFWGGRDQPSPEIQMLKQIQEAIQSLHDDMIKNFRIVQKQNAKIMEMLLEGFQVVDGKLEINRELLEDVQEQLDYIIQIEGLNERNRYDRKFNDERDNVERAIERIRQRQGGDEQRIPPAAYITSMDGGLTSIFNHGEVTSYTWAYSGEPQGRAEARSNIVTLIKNRQNPALLTGLIPSMLDYVGQPVPQSSIPNPVEFGRAFSTFLEFRATTHDIDPVQDRRLMEIFRRTSDVSEAIINAVNLESLQAARVKYEEAALAFVNRAGQTLDDFHSEEQLGCAEARYFAAPRYVEIYETEDGQKSHRTVDMDTYVDPVHWQIHTDARGRFYQIPDPARTSYVRLNDQGELPQGHTGPVSIRPGDARSNYSEYAQASISNLIEIRTHSRHHHLGNGKVFTTAGESSSQQIHTCRFQFEEVRFRVDEWEDFVIGHAPSISFDDNLVLEGLKIRRPNELPRIRTVQLDWTNRNTEIEALEFYPTMGEHAGQAFQYPHTLPLGFGLSRRRFSISSTAELEETLRYGIDYTLDTFRRRGLEHVKQESRDWQETEDLDESATIYAAMLAFYAYRGGVKLGEENWPSLPKAEDYIGHLHDTFYRQPDIQAGEPETQLLEQQIANRDIFLSTRRKVNEAVESTITNREQHDDENIVILPSDLPDASGEEGGQETEGESLEQALERRAAYVAEDRYYRLFLQDSAVAQEIRSRIDEHDDIFSYVLFDTIFKSSEDLFLMAQSLEIGPDNSFPQIDRVRQQTRAVAMIKGLDLDDAG